MSTAFAEATTHKRGLGHSATAGAAYRSRSVIVDERTGEVHDYSEHADELLHAEIVLPKSALPWLKNRLKDFKNLQREQHGPILENMHAAWRDHENVTQSKRALDRKWMYRLSDLDHDMRAELDAFAISHNERRGKETEARQKRLDGANSFWGKFTGEQQRVAEECRLDLVACRGRDLKESAALNAAHDKELERRRSQTFVQHRELIEKDQRAAWKKEREDYVRSAVWNAAEKREAHPRAWVSREWMVALPYELHNVPNAYEQMCREMADYISERHGGLAVDIAIHKPHEWTERDNAEANKNFHAHLLTSTRKMDATGFTDKAVELDKSTKSRKEIEAWRQEWTHIHNRTLERNGIDKSHHIDMRSYKRQDVEKEAQQKQGYQATHNERRRGIKNDVVIHNEDVKARNAARADVLKEERDVRQQIEAKIIDLEQEREKRRQQPAPELNPRQEFGQRAVNEDISPDEVIGRRQALEDIKRRGVERGKRERDGGRDR